MSQEYPHYESRSVTFQKGDLSILKSIAANPSQYRESLYYLDEETVTIYDAFPKSRFHLLLLPRRYIPDVSSLRPCHISLLEHMTQKGTEIANFLTQKYLQNQEEQTFLVGFHSIPSMDQLHLHIISTDFMSPFLKTRKHWNSFHTDFFLPASYVLQQVKAGRTVVTTKNRERYLDLQKQPLLCHRCKVDFRSMKTLKQHICECRYPYFGRQQQNVSLKTIDKYFIKYDSSTS